MKHYTYTAPILMAVLASACATSNKDLFTDPPYHDAGRTEEPECPEPEPSTPPAEEVCECKVVECPAPPVVECPTPIVVEVGDPDIAEPTPVEVECPEDLSPQLDQCRTVSDSRYTTITQLSQRVGALLRILGTTYEELDRLEGIVAGEDLTSLTNDELEALGAAVAAERDAR